MIKHLIARGIGFSPGSVKFIVTHGLGIGQSIGPDCYLNIQAPISDRNVHVFAPMTASIGFFATMDGRTTGFQSRMDDRNIHIEAPLCDDA